MLAVLVLFGEHRLEVHRPAATFFRVPFILLLKMLRICFEDGLLKRGCLVGLPEVLTLLNKHGGSLHLAADLSVNYAYSSGFAADAFRRNHSEVPLDFLTLRGRFV